MSRQTIALKTAIRNKLIRAIKVFHSEPGYNFDTPCSKWQALHVNKNGILSFFNGHSWIDWYEMDYKDMSDIDRHLEKDTLFTSSNKTHGHQVK